MKTNLLGPLTLTLLLSSTTAFATATVIDPQCQQQRQDQFDRGWRIGPESVEYGGLCVNTKSVRPIEILAENAESIEFANFYHAGRYWKARWSKSDLPTVQYLGVHFDVGIPLVKPAHTELRFRFAQGLRLSSQRKDQSGTEKRLVLKEVIVSWEAQFPENVSYSFLKGLQKNYPVAGRVLSLPARITEHFVPGKKLRQVDQYQLALSRREGAAVFLNSLRQSNQMRLSEYYGTLQKNCTDLLFTTLDVVLAQYRGLQVRPFQTVMGPDPILGPGRQALEERGLIQLNQKATDLAEELGLRAREAQ
ncbi:MAG: DUF4105 domain-containing protein [Bdellovibrio sp.]